MAGGTARYGRNKNRPAQKRYVAEGRSEKNKRRRISKHLHAVEEKKANPPKVTRGTKRSLLVSERVRARNIAQS